MDLLKKAEDALYVEHGQQASNISHAKTINLPKRSGVQINDVISNQQSPLFKRGGEELMTCPECEGRGRIKGEACPVCEGRKTVCNNCDGTGHTNPWRTLYPGHPLWEEYICPDCKGSGQFQELKNVR